MDNDGLEEWLAADPDDIAGALAYSQGDGPPGRKSPWPWLAALVAMLVVLWLLYK
jgi:hypothetical protein